MEVRGRKIKIREWTVAERTEFLKIRREDRLKSLEFMVRVCVADPVLTDEEIRGLPSKVYDEILNAVLDMNEEKQQPEKEDATVEAELAALPRPKPGEEKNA